jgi:hypothetical protein
MVRTLTTPAQVRRDVSMSVHALQNTQLSHLGMYAVCKRNATAIVLARAAVYHVVLARAAVYHVVLARAAVYHVVFLMHIRVIVVRMIRVP